MTESELPIGELLGFADDELIEFMRRNRRHDGGFNMGVKGWEYFVSSERDRLAERLRDASERSMRLSNRFRPMLANSPRGCLNLDLGRLQSMKDKEWKRLLNEGVVLLNESPESLRSHESVVALAQEVDRANRDVVSAEKAAREALQEAAKADQGRSRLTKAERIQSLGAAQSRLTEAREALEKIQKRSDPIINLTVGQRPYREVQGKAKQQSLLVQ
ncbi:hypothetical protein VTI74DRAFT_1544 [Chaetomium olivicolor]